MGKTAPLDYAPPARARRVRAWHWVLAVLLLFGTFWVVRRVRVGIELAAARRDSAAQAVTALQMGLDAFVMDNGRYPTTAEGLSALFSQPADLPTWKGPYLRPGATPLSDPWGRPYVYAPKAAPPPGPAVMSLGPDGKAGTADDIVLGP